MAAMKPIRRRKPSRCRFIKPWPTSSTVRIMVPRCSISKPKDFAIRASAIRRRPCSSVASPRSKVASMRCASRTGQAALNYAVLNLASMGSNIVSVPQLYGTTYTLFAHLLPSQGINVRFAEIRQRRRDRETDRRQHPRDLLRERRQSGRQCLRHRGAGDSRRAARRAADGRQYRGDADPAAPDRIRRRHRRALADQIHGRPRHDAGRRHRRQRPFSLARQRTALPDVQRAGPVLPRPGLHRSFRRSRLYRALPQRLSAHDRRGAGAAVGLPAAPGHRDRGAARRAARRECAPGRRISAPRLPRRVGQLHRLRR